jgi:hypothetical protein
MDSIKEKIISVILSGIILTIVLLWNSVIKFLTDRLMAPVKHWLTKKAMKIDEKALLSGRTVNNLLLELRVKTNSDRAAIFLFHNGQYFHPNILNNSIWKFTCAYESCKAGVSSESLNMQNLLLTHYLPLVETLWGKLSEGFEKYDCKNCSIDCTNSKNIIVISDYDTLPYGSTKSLFESQGIKKFIVSPIIIKDDYVGFIGVSYSTNFVFGTQMVENATPVNPNGIKTICEYANNIGYHLSNYR